MKHTHFRNLIALLLALLFTAALLPTAAFAVTQEEVNAMREKRDKLTAQRMEKQAVVDELEAEQAGILERKAAMDERNMYTLQQMQLNSEEIDAYDKMIAQKQREVEKAEALEAEQLERYRVRVRAMEENGNLGFLAMILKATSLGDLLTIMDDVGEIMQSDKELERAYVAAKEEAAGVKAEYEQVRSELEAKQKDLRSQQEALKAEIDEAQELLLSLREDIAGHQEEVAAIQAIEDEADMKLQQLMEELERQRVEEMKRQQEAAERAAARILEEQAAAQAAAQAKAEAAAAAAAKAAEEAAARAAEQGEQVVEAAPAEAVVIPTVVATGVFTWPVPSCTYVTSRFGLRIHPIYGTERTHSGIDVGAGYGAKIVAADSGTVIRAANIGDGYGNCVIIDHNNGYMTLYGHMSSMAVSEGQSVTKGSTVGYVGSTGLSTGPHCHFEVWEGGSRTDPEQFFGGLTFSEDAGE